MLEPNDARGLQARLATRLVRRDRRRRDLHRRIEQRKDPLRRGHRALQQVELLGQVADRPEEALRVLQERDQRAQRQAVAVDHPSAADPQNQRRRQRADQLDAGIERRVVEDRLDVGVTVLPVDLVEGIEVARLAAIELHRRHAGDALLQDTR